MNPKNKIALIVLAGGLSRRTGTFKMSLPLGKSTVLTSTCENAKIIDRVIVVTGHKKELIEKMNLSEVELVHNPDYLGGMFTSVQAGIAALDGEDFFIMPGDCPLVEKNVYLKMLQVFNDDGRKNLVMPTFNGKTGHPVLIPAKHAKTILNMSKDQTLRDFVYPNNPMRTDVGTKTIFMDIDNMDDYKNIKNMENISKSIARHDSRIKTSGRLKYLDDYNLKDILHARTLRSTETRARISKIDIPVLPKGYYTVDWHDSMATNRVQMILTDQPFFAEDKVNYIGEPILLVVGSDREIIEDILSNIKVSYEKEEAILTVEDAKSGALPPLFGDNNKIADYEFTKGDYKKAFEEADLVLQETFETGYQEQLYLEPQVIMASIDGEKMIIEGSMQCPYYVHKAMTIATGKSDKNVIIKQSNTGGAFGGKEDYPSLTAGQVAFAANKIKKTVKLSFDRTEDLIATPKRHPSRSFYKIAVKDKKITGLYCHIELNAGAYAGLSSVVLQRALFAAGSTYNIGNLRIGGTAYATNTVPSGAFRGFGAPQSEFAIERLIDEIALKLNENPLDFRREHFLKKGDTTSTSGLLRDNVPLQEIANRIEKITKFSKKFSSFQDSRLSENGKLQGIGLATIIHGCGFTGKGEEIIKGTAKLRKNADKTVDILVANVDMGQGAGTTLRKIVATRLEIPFEQTRYENPDTSKVPDSGPTVASRTCMIVGGLLDKCATEMKEQWDKENFEVSRTYKHPEYIKWDQNKLSGDAYPAYSWGATIVHVEVDPITWETDIIDVWTVFDLGTPIDERIIEGQIDGGTAQGLGYASMEVMECSNGRLKQTNIADYIIPTTMDLPRIQRELVLEKYENGPYGAKCAGELTLVGAAPAYANAVRNATGKKILKIPITPEYLAKIQELPLEDKGQT